MHERGEMLSTIVNQAQTRAPDLLSRRRAEHPESGHIMPHSVSRHRDFGEDLTWPGTEDRFGQGTPFPRHVRAGDITKIQRFVQTEWDKYNRGLESAVVAVQEAGGANRITVRLERFGVEHVGTFVRQGQLATVFPEYDL